MAELAPTTIARFWSKVDVGDPKDCWNWRAAKAEFGYVKFQNRKAHRVAYELLVGEIPDGQVACHRCDNPSCCNPTHIFLGSIGDNNRDASAKGRARYAKGQRHPHAKLSDAQVEEIRKSNLKGVELAKKYGVSPSTISGIKTYAHRN